MPGYRLSAWLRPLLTLVALAGVLSLAACGGGNGAPNNPFQGGAGPLTITPGVATTYSGNPFVFAVTGGNQPYTILTSDQAALPVVGTLNGNTLVVTPGNVGADTNAVLTVRDASGATTSALVTVRPALLLPASITITGNPNCAASGADLCSGQDGTASVTVTGPAGAPLAGRQVRFDVAQGTYSISSTGGPLVQSLTVATDQNGVATVRLLVPTTAATQIALIRATDVEGGSTVVGQFTIAQFVNGQSILSVVPAGKTTFTGPNSSECNTGGRASFFIFGGTPPYTVTSNFPSAIAIAGSPVLASGGSFTITTTNGICFTNLTLIVTDATGRSTLSSGPTVDNVVGTAAPAGPPVDITPSNVNSGPGGCNGNTYGPFVVTNGKPPYTIVLSASSGNQLVGWVPSATSLPTSASTFTLLGGTFADAANNPVALPQSAIVTIYDSANPTGQTAATIKCNP